MTAIIIQTITFSSVFRRTRGSSLSITEVTTFMIAHYRTATVGTVHLKTNCSFEYVDINNVLSSYIHTMNDFLVDSTTRYMG